MWRIFIILLSFRHLGHAGKEESSEENGSDDVDFDSTYVASKRNASTSLSTKGKTTKGEIVVEKFVDTLMASEKYLKMIESVESKLDHLETTVLDRANVILKYLVQVLRVVKTSPAGMLENSLKSLKHDLERLKQSILQQADENPNLRGNHEKLGKRRAEHIDTTLWKKEFENELNDAMLSPKTEKNITRSAQSAALSDNEAVIERLMETITASEKYLQKIESIDFRLNRLDIEVHEKANTITKLLTELKKNIQSQGYTDKSGPTLDLLKADVSEIKDIVEKCQRISSKTNVDNAECHLEATLDNRLSFLENHIKSLLANVEGISSVISEVKSRGRSRIPNKPDPQISSNGNALDAVTIISEFRRAIHEQKSRKCDCMAARTDRSERYPTDCQEIQAQGFNITGIYKIKPEDIEPFYVLCDLNSAGGGWTVIQNRFDGSQDFFKSWSEYKYGFGNLAGEFWLGLDKVYHLTNQKLYELRVEMEGQQGQEVFASFSVFTLGPEYEGYRISTLGTYRGNAGDSMSYHAGQKFSTYDVDNDEWKDGSCANEHGGAWWYKECDKRYLQKYCRVGNRHAPISVLYSNSNLNGKYAVAAEESTVHSMYWISFKGPNVPIYKSRIMIRPLPASRPSENTEKPKALLSNVKHQPEALKGRVKDSKERYDARGRPKYRYDDNVLPDGFFPNYA